MSEPEPKSVAQPTSSFQRTIYFMVGLSFICALILSILASALRVPQATAKEVDRSTQMLIATRTISPFGFFQVQNEKGEFVPARFTEGGVLEPTEGGEKVPATQDQILEVYRLRIKPFLVNDKGEETTFQKAGIDETKYTSEFRKTGYYLQPWKLIYKVFPNLKSGEKIDESNTPPEGYVIPVNGMGLWDAIYGYLAIKPDGNTVIGISWYDQKETPGLGANISEADWQSQFPGKHIFQESSSGKTDVKTASLGLTVVKGRVSEVYGNSPKALSAIDGMAGATLTGNGVTNAYKDVLAPYRPFLIRIHNEKANKQESKS